MGIFSFFSREEDDEDEYEEEQTQEAGRQPESALTGELFKGMRMDVTDKEGLPLLSGKVSEKSPDSLSLTRLPGELSFKIVTIGATVNINGFDKKLIPISLSGTVQESSRTIFKLKNLKVESHAENRDNFRLPYTAPVSLFRKEDDHFRHPEECTLINISTGGCCVQSEYAHIEDEVLRIRVKLDDYAPQNFLGQIVRCSEHAPGQFWYGILFAQLTEQETAALNKTLYNLQMGIKDTLMRDETGYWRR
ncbi:MAG: PilZ domain-containing protein [Lawsonibacter sp.]|nr:PilZ domain-containing protein [Lawsonibacter sp.]